MPVLDLRSDTVTRPTQEMRDAMFSAPVGDDVLGEDPTVNLLQDYAAHLCGVESALFVPSGTMANQIAIRTWCRNGDEALIAPETHVFFYEAGSAAGLSGVQLHPVPGADGDFDVMDFQRRIRPRHDPHFPLTRLLWIENTHNRGGGKIIGYDKMERLHRLGEQYDIPMHVDGARLVNAAVATGIPLDRWSRVCDSFSLCLSKGLGAPVGSLLLGSTVFIDRCRRPRKALGGGMRQAGIIAAAGLYALQHHIDRLAVDHRRASDLGRRLRAIPGLITPETVDTNILMIDLENDVPFGADELQRRLDEQGVKVFSVRERRIRVVFHLDLPENVVSLAENAFRQVMLSV
ncbi:low specificity L-threonine aldolase [bacterium]|nr:low specificity L-threonine aldolase [candidate division CSSED10-310 bacterium]